MLRWPFLMLCTLHSLPFISLSTLSISSLSLIHISMRIAQQLYEGVDIKGQGTVGIITYLRTDSVRVSDEAEAMACLLYTSRCV